MCALTDGNTSLAQGGSLVSATVVISSTSKAQITWWFPLTSISGRK
jgi:hypothetical protein